MHLHTANRDVRQTRGRFVNCADPIEGDPKFVLAPAGRDVAMRARLDVRIPRSAIGARTPSLAAMREV